MNLKKLDKRVVTPFLDRLQVIYAAMDRKYKKAAAHYNFNCTDCKDICCQTRFYHHTHIEYHFILEGFKTLDPGKKREIKSRALKVCRKSAELNQKGNPVRCMCPLNFDRLCVLYPFRPMICRLHGIPHELQKSAGNRIYAPGCGTFDNTCSEKSYFKFDRTPFYLEMADVENEFKQTAGITGRIKLTIAEMLSGLKLGAESEGLNK